MHLPLANLCCQGKALPDERFASRCNSKEEKHTVRPWMILDYSHIVTMVGVWLASRFAFIGFNMNTSAPEPKLKHGQCPHPSLLPSSQRATSHIITLEHHRSSPCNQDFGLQRQRNCACQGGRLLSWPRCWKTPTIEFNPILPSCYRVNHGGPPGFFSSIAFTHVVTVSRVTTNKLWRLFSSDTMHH